jgi:2-hydroxycyclohexanecarboxyl-CoA dehydrogenase
MRFAGKGVLVTGAGSGIGRATALCLANEGARVGVFDLHADRANQTVRDINAAGGMALPLTGDVRSPSDLSRAVEEIEREFGHLHYLVNNAGLVTMHGLDTLTEADWDLVLDVNLKGQFLAAQAAAPAIARSGGGAIVNLSTIESVVVVASGPHCQPHYNASKGGVQMLTKALAHELASRNIRVNAVAPGPVNTGFSGADLTSPEAMAFFRQRMLIPRPADPQEIARVIAFLLSDDAAFITGIQLPVDGGWLVH